MSGEITEAEWRAMFAEFEKLPPSGTDFKDFTPEQRETLAKFAKPLGPVVTGKE